MKVLVIAATDLRRFLRDRPNLFFVFVLPLLLILFIGLQFGSGMLPRVGVVAGVGPLSDRLVAALGRTEGIETVAYGDRGELRSDVERGRLDGGVVVPADYDMRLQGGEQVSVAYVAAADPRSRLLEATVAAAVAEEAQLYRAARFAGADDLTAARDAAARLRGGLSSVEVAVTEQGTEDPLVEEFAGLGQFDLGASTQLLLFVFLTSLAASSSLIRTRRLRVARRMLSTPTSVRSVLAGTTLGRFGIAAVQGLYIMGGSLLLFGVDWGDPLGAAAVLVVFALVGSGGGMLLGAVLDNDAQAGGLGVMLGLGLAALGGCMAPLELFPPTMQTVAHVTPHAWAVDAFAELVRRGGGLADIGGELAVLAGFAAVLLTVATWRLQRSLTRA